MTSILPMKPRGLISKKKNQIDYTYYCVVKKIKSEYQVLDRSVIRERVKFQLPNFTSTNKQINKPTRQNK